MVSARHLRYHAAYETPPSDAAMNIEAARFNPNLTLTLVTLTLTASTLTEDHN